MIKQPSIIPLILLCCFAIPSFAQVEENREWSDSTGNFKVTASLIEVKDGNVFLKTTQGKTIKIPVARLSKADQELLKGADNPFQEVGEGDEKMPGESGNASATDSSSGNAGGWNSPLKIDWEDVDELDRSFDGEWKFELPKLNDLGFTAKRATLNKKDHFPRRHSPPRSQSARATCCRRLHGQLWGSEAAKPFGTRRSRFGQSDSYGSS